MFGNIIDSCSHYGMHLVSGSQPVMRDEVEDAANRIADCDDYEINITGYLYPLINSGHNDIIDADIELEDYLINGGYNPNGSYSYNCTHNYWGDLEEVRDYINPENDPPSFVITVGTVDNESNTGYEIESIQEDTLYAALDLEMDGYYSQACSAYANIVASFPNDPLTITAFTRMFYCTEHQGGSFSDLYSYYNQTASSITNTSNLFYLQRMQGRSLRKMESFQDALDLYNNLLTSVADTTDSIFVLVDIENTQYEMSMSGRGTSALKEYSDPSTADIVHRQRVNDLYAILDGKIPERPGRGDEEIPDSHKLLSFYPNPFNSSANIEFMVSEVSKTSAKIYSVSGQEVCTLVDGIRCPGKVKVAWDARNYASGVYFLRLNIDPLNGGSAISRIEKLMLIK